MPPSNTPHIIVLGAGVTGLTTALFLAEAGCEVTIIAAHVPGDESIEYTSPWAGAHWRTHATSKEPVLCDWDVQSYEYWVQMIEREGKDSKLPRSGLEMYDSYCYYDPGIPEDYWWAPYVQDFRPLHESEDPVSSLNEKRQASAKNAAQAVVHRSMAINVSQYLLYLQEKAEALGARIIKARLPTSLGVANALSAANTLVQNNGRPRPSCFVNATGIGAAKLCSDKAVYPIRGQTALVKGEAKAIHTWLGSWGGAYCIPRPGTGMSILGGTKEPGNWSESVDPKTTEMILRNCRLIVPELLTGADGGFEVVSAQCGLRPGREGGPRVEREDVEGWNVVHAYGHAGAGYQNSVGSARVVVSLVQESLGSIDGQAPKL